MKLLRSVSVMVLMAAMTLGGPAARAQDAPAEATGVDPDNLGQGASNQTLVVSFGEGDLEGFPDGAECRFVTPAEGEQDAQADPTIECSVSNVDGENDDIEITASIGEESPEGPRDIEFFTGAGEDEEVVAVCTEGVVDPCFEVNLGPKVDSLDPASGSPGETVEELEITGHDFDSDSDCGGTGEDGEPFYSFDFGDGITVGEACEISEEENPHQTVTLTIVIADDAAAGPRDVVVVNLVDQGTATCTGCFTVEALAVDDDNGNGTATPADDTAAGADDDPAPTPTPAPMLPDTGPGDGAGWLSSDGGASAPADGLARGAAVLAAVALVMTAGYRFGLGRLWTGGA